MEPGRASFLLSLIMLTQLDGNPIWVESSQVIILKPSRTGDKSQCPAPARSTINVGTRGLCVMEHPDEIREKIKAAK